MYVVMVSDDHLTVRFFECRATDNTISTSHAGRSNPVRHFGDPWFSVVVIQWNAI